MLQGRDAGGGAPSGLRMGCVEARRTVLPVEQVLQTREGQEAAPGLLVQAAVLLGLLGTGDRAG